MVKMKNMVRIKRIERNLRQAELAEMACCSQQEISAIEKGEVMPTIFVALCIARALETTVDELFIL